MDNMERKESPWEPWQDASIEQICKNLQSENIKALVEDYSVRFIWSGIAEHADWSILGDVSFLPHIQTGPAESLLQLGLVIAKESPEKLRSELALRLMELNELCLVGHLGIDWEGQLYYFCRLPLISDKPEDTAHSFEYAFYEMLEFLDQFYPYLLIILNDPDKITLEQYLELTIPDPDELDDLDTEQ